MHAELIHQRHLRRIHVGFDRIEIRRHEHPRAGAAHLVHVEREVRMPEVVQLRDGEAGFLLREHEPVAVVVVPGVFVIEARQLGALERRAEVLAIPLHYQQLAVGIVAGQHDRYHVLPDCAARRRFIRHQVISQLRRHLGGAHLGRVNAAIDQHHTARLCQQLGSLALRERPRVCQARLRPLPAFELREIFRCADEGHVQIIALGGLAQVLHLQPVGGRIQLFEVGDDLMIIRQLVIAAQAKAKVRFRWRNMIGSAFGQPRVCRPGERQQYQQSKQEQCMAAQQLRQ